MTGCASDSATIRHVNLVFNKTDGSPTVSIGGLDTYTFTVRNTGTKTASTTPQVYLTLPASAGEPGSRLVAFDTVTLGAGASKRVSLTIDPASVDRPLSYYSTAASAWVTAPGGYRVAVGDAATAALSATFTLAG